MGVEEEWTGRIKMVGDMWDRGLKEGDFASLQQIRTPTGKLEMLGQ